MRRLHWVFYLVLVSAAAGQLTAEDAKQITLTSTGHSEYVIVVGAQSQIPERFGAEELQKYIRLISGVTLPILDHPAGHKRILVGTAAGHLESLQGRDADSYLIRIHSGEISLAGASPR